MRFLSLLWLVIVLLIVPVVQAQDGDGLSEEEQALLDRAIQGVEAENDYESLVRESHSIMSQGITIVLGEDSSSMTTVTELDIVGTRIGHEDERNLSATITARVENTRDDTVLSAFTMMADVRVVDGVLYVQAWYDDPGENAPELPEGWVIVANEDDYPAFSPLGLDDFLEDDSNDLGDNPEALRAAASSVSSETTDDGESITIAIEGTGIPTLLADMPDSNPVFESLMEVVDDDDQIVYEVLLDEQGNLLGGHVDWAMTMVDLDPALFGVEQLPEGAALSFSMQNTIDVAYSQINEELEPAVVPEELAE
jgi:hypothetical protein